MTNIKPRFQVNQWVTFVAGSHKGKSTTLIRKSFMDGIWVYCGYYCGILICGRENELKEIIII